MNTYLNEELSVNRVAVDESERIVERLKKYLKNPFIKFYQKQPNNTITTFRKYTEKEFDCGAFNGLINKVKFHIYVVDDDFIKTYRRSVENVIDDPATFEKTRGVININVVVRDPLTYPIKFLNRFVWTFDDKCIKEKLSHEIEHAYQYSFGGMKLNKLYNKASHFVKELQRLDDTSNDLYTISYAIYYFSKAECDARVNEFYTELVNKKIKTIDSAIENTRVYSEFLLLRDKTIKVLDKIDEYYTKEKYKEFVTTLEKEYNTKYSTIESIIRNGIKYYQGKLGKVLQYRINEMNAVEELKENMIHLEFNVNENAECNIRKRTFRVLY